MPSASVFSGETFEPLTFAAATFDGDRVPLPARLAGSLHLEGNNSIKCLLLVMSAGRYRVLLLPAKGPGGDTGQHRLLKRFDELGAGDDVYEASDNVQAALRARLIPTLISPMGAGWRI